VHKFEFRDFKLTELEYTDLAEGFAGGKGPLLVSRGAGTWEARKGGGIASSGDAVGWLGTATDDWADFSFKMEYRLAKDVNSGVFLRCPLEGNPSYEGIEIQIVDDDTKRWALQDHQHTGAIHGALAPTQRATRSAGTWESLEITARGSRVVVHLNGFQVLDADLDRFERKAGEAKALKDRPRKGYVGIQSPGTGLELRDVRVKKL
jgi:hypothetical protein